MSLPSWYTGSTNIKSLGDLRQSLMDKDSRISAAKSALNDLELQILEVAKIGWPSSNNSTRQAIETWVANLKTDVLSKLTQIDSAVDTRAKSLFENLMDSNMYDPADEA